MRNIWSDGQTAYITETVETDGDGSEDLLGLQSIAGYPDGDIHPVWRYISQSAMRRPTRDISLLNTYILLHIIIKNMHFNCTSPCILSSIGDTLYVVFETLLLLLLRWPPHPAYRLSFSLGFPISHVHHNFESKQA